MCHYYRRRHLILAAAIAAVAVLAAAIAAVAVTI